MNIALSSKQIVAFSFLVLIALFILSIVMLYAVAHIDVLHLILSDGGGILPNAIFPRG